LASSPGAEGGNSPVDVRDNRGLRRLVASAAALTLAACGGGSTAGGVTQPPPRTAALPGQPPGSITAPRDPEQLPPGFHNASPNATAVITAWADTLRSGHPSKAAAYFDLPVVVQNAGPPVRLTTHNQILAFNEDLPCGAHVVKTIAGARYTVATFVLTDPPGAPVCGATGKLAATAFLLRHGKISEWRRVLVPPPLGPPENVQTPKPAS
jgi:hypothetical protein